MAGEGRESFKKSVRLRMSNAKCHQHYSWGQKTTQKLNEPGTEKHSVFCCLQCRPIEMRSFYWLNHFYSILIG